MNEYKIVFTLRSNLHIGSGFSLARLIDKTTVKNGNGIVYIPASTIKGKLRSVSKKIALTIDEFGVVCHGKDSLEVCKTELDKACIICRLFGSVYNEGKLIFTDASLLTDDEMKIKYFKKMDPFTHFQSEYQSGNRLYRTLRTSSAKHLYVSESCLEGLVFEGKMYLKRDMTEDEKKLLKWSIKSLTHIGGHKGRGLGRVTINIEGI